MQSSLRDLAGGLIDRPATCAALLAAIVMAFSLSLGSLKMDSSANGLIVEDFPETLAYENIKRTFGDDVAFTVVYRAENLFTPEILASLDDVSFGLEDIDGVTRVVSLSTVSDLRADQGDLSTSLLMAYPPESQAEADAIRDNALSNELLAGEVIGTEGKTAALHAYIESRPDDKAFERRTLETIETLLEEQRTRLGPAVEIYVSGAPVVSVAIVDNLLSDGSTLAPISIVVVALVLLAFFRTAIVVVLPIVTGIASVSVTLGFMALLGFEINPLSIIIPSLLLVVGATEDIHLLSEYAVALGQGKDKKPAIRAMMRVCIMAIFLTSLTTTIGFLTLAPHGIPMIAEFGMTASFGMAINLVLTILATPLVAKFMPIPNGFERPPTRLDTVIKAWIGNVVIAHRRWVMIGGLMFLAASAALATRVVVDNDFLSFFDEEAEIRQLLIEQSQDVSGASVLLVEVDTQREQGLMNPDALTEIAKLTDFLSARHDDVVSYDLFIRKTHKEVNGGDQTYFAVPDDANLISQYTLLIAPDTLSRFANFELSRALIVVRTMLSRSRELDQELTALRDFADREISPAMTVRFSGSQVLVAQSADTLSSEIVTNLAYVFVAIFILLTLLFSSIRAGLLSLVPNLVPIVGVFGAMGLLDIPLDTSVFPVAVIALGIAVDDTIHFMARYSHELRQHEANEDAIRSTIEHEFRPVVTSSAALIAGFFVLTFASFGSIQQFGLLAAIAMVLAVLADLIVTPALLVTTPIVNAWDMLQMRLPQNFGAKSELLRGLTKGEMRRVAGSAIRKSYAPGEVMLRQGETGRDMLLILSGSTEVAVQEPDGTTRHLAETSTGSALGERGFLTNRPRAVNVTARDEVKALQISANTLDRIKSRNPRLAAKLLHNIAVMLADRLHTTQSSELEAPSRS